MFEFRKTSKIWDSFKDFLKGWTNQNNNELHEFAISKHKLLYEHGYYIGNTLDLIDNPIELDYIMIKIQELIKDKQNYFRYRNQIENSTEYTHYVQLDQLEERRRLIQENNFTLFQQWYEIYKSDSKVENIKDYFRKKIENLLFELYPELNTKNIEHIDTISLYENGDFIKPHSDGQNLGRLCVILIYLTEKENYNDGGGKLIISNKDLYEEVLPVRGNYVILDFTQNNVSHAVEPVKNDFSRLCYISFVNNKDKVK